MNSYTDSETQLEYPAKWAMPNKNTFSIKPIRNFIKKHDPNIGEQFDLFPFTDEDPKDCLQIMKEIPTGSITFATYDPIFSKRQRYEMYSIKGTDYQTHPEYFQAVDRELLRIMKPFGIVLKFMFNGKRIPGFQKFDGLIVDHGGQHNATICTAHRKIQERLF